MELACINTNTLSIEEKKNIDSTIDQLISRHKNNRYQINRLVFESVAALTSSENYSRELASQGRIKRFWNGITGKNRSLQEGIDRGLVHAQYASQQTLQKLAEQNLMSFELITAVNNKLNASMIEVETEINKIYSTLVTFFKQSRSDIIQLESRVARLEKNVNILNWQNSIEYQMYNGIEYIQLNDTTKIVCLVRDFYNLTDGEWTTSDLLLLKTAMATIGLDPRGVISYENFMKGLYVDATLYHHLVSEELRGVTVETEYAMLMAGINKLQSLNTGEQYLVNSSVKLLEKHGLTETPQNVAYNMMNDYIIVKEKVNFAAEVNLYEFILELLYNLGQTKEAKHIGEIELRNQKIAKLKQYTDDAAILDKVDIVAFDQEELDDLLNEGEGVIYLCEGQFTIPLNIKNKMYIGIGEVEVVIASKDKIDFEALDIKLENVHFNSEYANLIQNTSKELYDIAYNAANEQSYTKAMEYYKKAANLGDSSAMSAVGDLYYNGQGVEKNYQIAIEWFKKAADLGNSYAHYSIGWQYQFGQGVNQDYQTAMEWYKKAADLGNAKAMSKIGDLYYNAQGVGKDFQKAMKWYRLAADKGNTDAMCCIGKMYRYANGVQTDYQESRRWYLLAADQGNTNAMIEVASSYLSPPQWRDDQEAFNWYCLAAEKGNAEAMFSLGVFYEHGQGNTIAKDFKKAQVWYKRAAELGHEHAKRNLQHVNWLLG